MKTLCLMLSILAAGWAAAAELTLDQALDAALASHPLLEVAAARAEATAAAAEQAGAWPNPSVFLRLEDAPRDDDAWSGANRLAGFSQTIPWGGRIGAEKQAAEAMADRAGLEQRIALAELRARVKIAFAEAVYAREMSSLAEESARSAEQLLEIARAKVHAGDAAGLDLHRAAMASGQARIELASARGVVRSTLDELAALTNSDVDAVSGELNVPTWDASIETLLPRLDESPYLLAAERSAAASAALVSAASRRRLPELEIEAGLRTAPGVESFDVGIGFSLPLFDRGGARLSAARADVMAATARTRSVRRELETEMNRLVTEFGAAREAASLYEDSLSDRSDSILAAAQAAYDAGEVSMGDVLQVRSEWIGAQTARFALMRDLIGLESRIRARLGE